MLAGPGIMKFFRCPLGCNYGVVVQPHGREGLDMLYIYCSRCFHQAHPIAEIEAKLQEPPPNMLQRSERMSVDERERIKARNDAIKPGAWREALSEESKENGYVKT